MERPPTNRALVARSKGYSAALAEVRARTAERALEQPRLNTSMMPPFGAERAKSAPTMRPRTQHFEQPHFADRWRLDLRDETRLGIVPAEWSTSSQMNDPRPNGVSIFDARFASSPMGRARAGRSLVWDPRGTANAGQAAKVPSVDITIAYAKMHAAKTKVAAKQAHDAEHFDGIQTFGQSEAAMTQIALAQMSAMQRATIDKDGDGRVSMKELQADGFRC